MQCKDIPDQPIIEFVWDVNNRDRWANWISGDDVDVHAVFPPGVPDKLVLAKMRKLIGKGLLDGCACGCRGDFVVTMKGCEVIGRPKHARFPWRSTMLTQLDLLPSPQHDPGGKSRSRLLPGVNGDAEFCGPNDCYRPVLRRWRGDAFPERFVLFVGMNPSTAEATFNDPTIAREWSFTEAWGYSGMVKVNVSDYRLTDPKKLKDVGAPLESDGNLFRIRRLAAEADKIVMAHGKLPKPLVPLRWALMHALTVQDRRELWCFKKNADGSPKHSLYVAAGTPLQPF